MSHLPHLYAPCKGVANGVFTISISILNHLHHIFAEPNLRKNIFFVQCYLEIYIIHDCHYDGFHFLIATGHVLLSDFKTNKS